MEKKIGIPLVELAKLAIGKTSTLNIDLNNVTVSLGDSKVLRLSLGGKLKINISHLK
jgi:hypothetical protein